MKQVKNWCSSNDIAKELQVSHEMAKNYVDIVRGRNFVMYHQTNEVKRMNANFEIEKEYVINYPIEMVLPLIKEAINIS